ncbi:acetyltransferase [Xylariaceae sp. FL0804]|nr:acetyltransferase [Xylariaceae sp. FL0804]
MKVWELTNGAPRRSILFTKATFATMAARAPNPVGPQVDTSPAQQPQRDIRLAGRYITVIGLEESHADAFYPLISGEDNAPLWDYMFDGPFDDPAAFRANMATRAASRDPVFFSLVPADQPRRDAAGGGSGGGDNVVLGVASYLRIEPRHRCVEVGNLMFSRALQRTPAATEALYLLLRHAFDGLGYRRCEWKCDALNAPSRRAALRLGFAPEGLFRRHLIVKGRSRDTAWYALVEDDWPAARRALEAWLDPSNFDERGAQRKRLEEFRE